MRVADLFAAGEPVFSFEFSPPRTPEAAEALFATIATLRTLEPGFVSVTYGAGGSTRDLTVEIVERIQRETGLTTVAHLTCVGASRDALRGVVRRLAAAGVENVLALRGDPPRGAEHFEVEPDGLEHASELVSLVREEGPFCVGGACYPEVHQEAPDAETDLRRLREKVDAGAEFLITQLFFDNADYFSFVERARAVGIDVPIVPGIMPVTSVGQIRTITGLCGATIPQALQDALEERRDDPQAVVDLGVAYATAQCAELLRGGAPGIQFYTLNRSPATRAILSALRIMRPWDSVREPPVPPRPSSPAPPA